jgi:hypothetical protein
VESRAAHEAAIAEREAEIAALKTKTSSSSKKANAALAKAAQAAQAAAKVRSPARDVCRVSICTMCAERVAPVVVRQVSCALCAAWRYVWWCTRYVL